MYVQRLEKSCRAFMTKADGNFALFAAALVPVVFAVASLAVDTTNAFSMKARLQNAADAAALATSSGLAQGVLAEADAKAYAEKFFEGAVFEDASAYSGFSAKPDIDINPIKDSMGRTTWQVTVNVTGSQELTPMAAMLGQDKLTIGVYGKSESAAAMQGAFSMVLVVDKSGSMDWYGVDEDVPSNGNPKKIDSLKSAVSSLADQVTKADPDKLYSRLGVASYDTKYKTQKIKWGAADAKSYVDKLKANGGTSSTGAFKWAYEQLKTLDEDDEHKPVNNLTPLKYILFMTDGANNNDYDDWYTQYYCDLAKSKKIVIYSVAFMAPEEGKALLSYCATDAGHYFDADNSEQLIKAFENIGMQAAKMVSRLVE